MTPVGGFKGWVKRLLAPAEDPRLTSAPAAERQQEVLEKVRQARAKLVSSKNQLQAKVAEGRERQRQLDAQAAQDPFALQLRQIVSEELAALERDIADMETDERELALVEQRLASQVETLAAHQETLKARYTATKARVQLRTELGGLPANLAELGLALEKAEQRSEEIQARAAALEHVAGLGSLKAGPIFRDPAAQELASRYASEANLEQAAALKQQLGSGFKTILELEFEYRQLQSVLERRKGTDPLSIAYLPDLGEETYLQGLSILKDALDLAEAIRSPSRETLEREIGQMEAEAQELKQQGTEVSQVRARFREERVASHRQRLEMVQRQQLRIDDLMHQGGRCVAALNQTRVELAALKVEGARSNVDAVTESLQKTIKEAKEVQEELKRLGL